MARKKKKGKVKKLVNSYVLAHPDEPYEDLKLLQKYLKQEKKIKLKLEKLKKLVDKQLKKEERDEKIEKLEAQLFTKDGEPRKYKYASAFCDNCFMYKDHQKECPYCGDLEMTG